jgi:hypothetical protein
MEQFIQCKKCNSIACVETPISEFNKAWLCYTCGFVSSTLHKKGSEILKQADELLPELYKDLLFTDKDECIWYPASVNDPEKGMVFLDGTNKDNIQWAGILATDVKEDEKEKFPIPHFPGEFYTKKMDMTTLKHFNKLDFMSAAEYIGLFEPVEEEI